MKGVIECVGLKWRQVVNRLCKRKNENKKRTFTIEMEWEKMELMAEYYQFPNAAYFLPLQQWREAKKKDNTRIEALARHHDVLLQVIGLLEDAGMVMRKP